MFRRLAILSLSSAIALLTPMAQAETLKVRLVLSDSSPPYQQFSAELKKTLAASNADVALVESQNGNGVDAGLVIAVGMKAVESAYQFNTPVLGVMIPRMGYEALLEKHPWHHRAKEISAIYLDQPWGRQLNFIQAALPGHETVGLLYSSDTHITLPRLPRGMLLNAQSTSAENLFSALESVLDNSDVLLVIPDSEIYSSGNVRNILLTSYRYRVPLIGISQAYVNAGALGAVFSTPEQIAGQTVTAILAFSRDGKLPEPQYPELFSIALNPQVARSLGIVLDAPETIRERMGRAGEGRQ